MRKLRAIFFLLFVSLTISSAQQAQEEAALEVESLDPQFTLDYDLKTRLITGTNGVIAKYADAVLTADKAILNQESYEPTATAPSPVRWLRSPSSPERSDRISWNT